MAAHASVLLIVFETLVRLRLYRPSSWPLRHQVFGEQQLDAARRVAGMVNSVARHLPWTPGCLVRSLALVTMLNRQRIAACLRIGVRIIDTRLEAHAWVEHGGLPINDRRDIASDFLPFDSDLPPSAFASP